MTQTAGQRPKKILFLGHDASRTGAPILLLHLLRWLKENGGVSLEVILKSGGPLAADYAAIAPTTVLAESRFEQFVGRVCRRLGRPVPTRFTPAAKVAAYARDCGADLVYANTVAVADAVSAMAPQHLPVLWHVHEMAYVIRCFEGGKPFRDASRMASKFIACSESVRDGLIADQGIAPDKIEVIHEFIRPQAFDVAARAEHRASVRKELGWPADAFVAGMCGTVEWRKGADWFLNMGRRLAADSAAQPVYLLWIGGPDNEMTQIQLDHDLRRAGWAERVRFIGRQRDSQRYLTALDAFTLTSREDPFPLAMLEAAALGLPVLCFRDSGGGPEFVGTDAGVVVNYGDTDAMAAALIELRDQPARRRQMGAAAREKVLAQFSVEAQAPKVLRLIEKLTDGADAATK